MSNSRHDATVTVIVPTKDRPEMLSRTVRSLLLAPEVAEVIVVDDGSAKPVDLDLQRVRVVRHPTSRGEGAAVNTGWALTSTPYAMVVSDDDPQLPTLLSRLVAAAAECPTAVAWYPSTIEVVGGRLGRFMLGRPVPRQRMFAHLRVPCLAGVLINAAGLRAIGLRQLRDPAVVFPSDTVQWLTISKYGDFVAVPEAVALWWRHSGQLTSSNAGVAKAQNYVRNISQCLRKSGEGRYNALPGFMLVRGLQCLTRMESIRPEHWQNLMHLVRAELPESSTLRWLASAGLALIETVAYRLDQVRRAPDGIQESLDLLMEL